MPHTLVTGANSFVAAHIINELIARGHKVTGSIRRSSSGDEILALHPEWKSHLDFVQVADYAAPDAWDRIFRDNNFDYLIHVAAPLLNPSLTDYDRDYLRPNVEGNLSLLRSAKAYAHSLKAVAITGSINACTTGSPDELEHPLTNSTYNPITQTVARDSGNQFLHYCSAKKEAELAAWKFVADEKPAFGVTIFLPGLIFGPPIQPVKNVKHLNFSSGYFYGLFDGSVAGKPCPKTMFPAYIDARDLAAAHVKALTTPAVHGKRYLIGGSRWTNSHAVDTIRALASNGELPRELEDKLPGTPGEDVDVPVADQQGAQEANEVLGMTGRFRGLEETVGDFVRKIAELEKKKEI